MAKKKRLIDYVCSEEKLSSNEEICLLGHAKRKLRPRAQGRTELHNGTVHRWWSSEKKIAISIFFLRF